MLKKLLTEMTDIDIRAAEIKKEKAECQGKINDIVIDRIKQARLSQGKDTGAINILVDGVEVRHTLPKKIVWDQEKLSEIFEKIRAVAEDPTDYMTVKFSVTEKNYKQFVPEIKEHFIPARTVETGSPKIELKIREES
jgi:hypothetical protein